MMTRPSAMGVFSHPMKEEDVHVDQSAKFDDPSHYLAVTQSDLRKQREQLSRSHEPVLCPPQVRFYFQHRVLWRDCEDRCMLVTAGGDGCGEPYLVAKTYF